MGEYELLMEIKKKWNELYGKKKFIEKFANYLQGKELELSK